MIRSGIIEDVRLIWNRFAVEARIVLTLLRGGTIGIWFSPQNRCSVQIRQLGCFKWCFWSETILNIETGRVCYSYLCLCVCFHQETCLPVDQVRCCSRSEVLSDAADALKTPQAAEKMTTPASGHSDAPGWQQLYWNYPKSSGPLEEFCRIKLKKNWAFCGIKVSFHSSLN